MRSGQKKVGNMAGMSWKQGSFELGTVQDFAEKHRGLACSMEGELRKTLHILSAIAVGGLSGN